MPNSPWVVIWPPFAAGRGALTRDPARDDAGGIPRLPLRDAARTIRSDDPPARPAALRVRDRGAPRLLNHGRRFLERLRPRRPRRRDRRLYRGLSGGPARAPGRARRRGQDRRDVPPPRLHSDEGTP